MCSYANEKCFTSEKAKHEIFFAIGLEIDAMKMQDV